MKLTKLITTTLLLTLISGCGYTRYQAKYDFEIVESSPKTEQSKVSDTKFEDEYINASFIVGVKDISLNIMNKTPNSMKILWDDCAVIDEEGFASRVIHEGILYVNRDAPQAPSLIPGNGLVRDSIVPSKNVSFYSGQPYHQKLLPMPISAPSHLAKEFKVQVEKQYGTKPLGLILALEVEGQKREYRFVFQIKGATITEEKTMF